jgi:tetratricopeptide (TPR) repeat protein
MVHPGGKVLLTVSMILRLSGSSLLAQQPDTSLIQRYSEEAQRALGEQRYADAEKAYEKLRELEPGTAEVHANLGALYFQEKKFTQAVASLRQALKLKPNLAKADTLLAISLSELGQYTEALPGLEKGFRRSTDPAVKRMCGLQLERAYTGLRRDSKAVEVALELNRLYPDDPEVLYHTGRLFGNFAYLTVQKLQEVAPTSVWMRLTAGDIYESQEHYDLAISEYRQVLALDPHRPGIHFRLGRALLARSQPTNSAEGRAEAMREFEQELQLDPTNANAAYELGEIHRKAGQRDKAEEFFETALKYYPDFEEAQVGLSRVLIALGKPDLALPHLRKAVSLNPEDSVCYYHLFQVHKALGNVTEQQKALAEFQRLRSQREREERSLIKGALSPREVTKQELDSEAAP